MMPTALSAAIMYYALREYGVRARIYVPERSDGYGLSREGIDGIFAEGVPDLFVTVEQRASRFERHARAAQIIVRVIVGKFRIDDHAIGQRLPKAFPIFSLRWIAAFPAKTKWRMQNRSGRK